MSKILKIATCEECPHCIRLGYYACLDLDKILEFSDSKFPVIPEWCELEDDTSRK